MSLEKRASCLFSLRISVLRLRMIASDTLLLFVDGGGTLPTRTNCSGGGVTPSPRLWSPPLASKTKKQKTAFVRMELKKKKKKT